jgi:hypothetical protein
MDGARIHCTGTLRLSRLLVFVLWSCGPYLHSVEIDLPDLASRSITHIPVVLVQHVLFPHVAVCVAPTLGTPEFRPSRASPGKLNSLAGDGSGRCSTTHRSTVASFAKEKHYIRRPAATHAIKLECRAKKGFLASLRSAFRISISEFPLTPPSMKQTATVPPAARG